MARSWCKQPLGVQAFGGVWWSGVGSCVCLVPHRRVKQTDKPWAFHAVAAKGTAENRVSRTLLKPSKVLPPEPPLAVPPVPRCPGSSLQWHPCGFSITYPNPPDRCSSRATPVKENSSRATPPHSMGPTPQNEALGMKPTPQLAAHLHHPTHGSRALLGHLQLSALSLPRTCCPATS